MLSWVSLNPGSLWKLYLGHSGLQELCELFMYSDPPRTGYVAVTRLRAACKLQVFPLMAPTAHMWRP